MSTTIAVKKEVTTLINILTVEPEDHSRLVELLRDSTEKVVSKLDARRMFHMCPPRVPCNVSYGRSQKSVQPRWPSSSRSQGLARNA